MSVAFSRKGDEMFEGLVLGSSGYLGRKVVSALEETGGVRVTGASRTPRDDQVGLDLSDEATFAKMEEFDLVINCADTLSVDPSSAIRFCLERGVDFWEPTADPVLIRRLIETYREPDDHDRTGTLLVGAGIFPGFSNMLAAEAARRAPSCKTLTLGLRWSPFSAGGGGMVNLMTHLLNVPIETFDDGRVNRREASVERGPDLPYPTGEHRTMLLPFGEPTMLARSVGCPNIRTVATFVPSVTSMVLPVVPLVLLRNSVSRALMWLFLISLRKYLLAWRATRVEMVAVAEHEDGGETTLQLDVDDGTTFGGVVMAAMLEQWRGLEETPSGLVMPDELFEFDRLVDVCRDRFSGSLRLEENRT